MKKNRSWGNREKKMSNYTQNVKQALDTVEYDHNKQQKLEIGQIKS